MKKVLVVGATNLDIIARLSHSVIPRDSNPANISSSWGGVGHNIALNLAHLGMDVHFLTAVSTDVFGASLKAYFAKEEVNIGRAVETTRSTGVYFCLISPEGKMEVAAVDTQTIEALTKEEIAKRQDYLNAFDYLVLDANLNEEAIGEIFSRSKAKIIVEATSGEKVKKFIPFLSKIYMLKCNILEAEQLTGIKEKPVKQAGKLLSFGIEEAVITQGAGPVIYTIANKIMQKEIPKAPSIIEETGAGDAFTAGLVYGKAAGLETEKTIALAVRLAQHTLSQPGAVVPLGSKDEFLGGIR